jgi:2-(1,2-epoxy-1,2-dihydrophenyl)acetyl-CoA isomerase
MTQTSGTEIRAAVAHAPVAYVVRDRIAHLTLERPAFSNAFDLPLAEALQEAVALAAASADVDVILVSGAGKRFCAGGDVASMAAAEDQASYLEHLAGAVDAALLRLLEVEKPVVAAVHGAVAGAGLALMLSCDLVIADEDTTFVSAYAGVGLTPDCGLSWLLPRAVGQMRALELLLTRRALSAAEAQQWGLVTEVATSGAAHTRAAVVAAGLAGGPAYAYGQARRLSRDAWERSRPDLGADEAMTIARAVRTPFAQERIAAFLSH